MGKYILILSVFITCCLKPHAQRNLLKATIHTIDNVVIEVYIRKNFPTNTPQAFDYAVNEGGPFQTITADKLKRIEFADGRVFERNFISIPVIYNNYMERTMNDYQRPENQFSGNALVEKVIAGSLSLYQFIDIYQFEHFFYRDGSDTGLTYIPNVTYVTDRSIFNQDRSFKEWLKQMVEVKNCSSRLNQEIEKLQYDLPSMLFAFKEMNACSGTPVDIKTYTRRTRPEFDFGLIAGASFWKAYHLFYLSRSGRPVVGAYLQILPRKGYQNYFFNFEITYQSYKADRDFPTADREMKLSSIDLDPSAHIFFNKKPSGFFFKGGVNFKILIVAKETAKGTASPYGENVIDLKKGPGYGLIAGAGYDLGKFSIVGQYVHDISNLFDYNSFIVTARVKLATK